MFRDIAVSMITGSSGCIVMFDLTKRDTFLSVQSFWKTSCDKQAGEKVQYMLIGNKLDLVSEKNELR